MRNQFLFVCLGLVTFFTLSACRDGNRSAVIFSVEQDLDSTLEVRGGAQGKSFFILPDSNDLSRIPQDPLNPITPAKVELGKMLFHETGLAVNHVKPQGVFKHSCASCHNKDAGFASGAPQGIAEGGINFGIRGEARRIDSSNYQASEVDVQPLKAPANLNVAFVRNTLWNGSFGAGGVNNGIAASILATPDTPKKWNGRGYQGVEVQAIAGMAVHRMISDDTQQTQANNQNSVIFNNPTYAGLFTSAFGDPTPSQERVGLAVAAFERTMLTNEAPFQLYLKGNKQAMTDRQKRGALLFFGKARCYECHTGPSLNSMTFHALGMRDFDPARDPRQLISDPGANLGRGGFTGNPDDNFKFKTPQLYNVKDHGFYGHGNSFTSVRQVIQYKNAAFSQNPNVIGDDLSPKFRPLGLTQTEVSDLTEFVAEALYDPTVRNGKFTPASLPSGLCSPNRDVLSLSLFAAQTGCN